MCHYGKLRQRYQDHLKSFGDGFADSTLKMEAELLFTRAGKLHVIIWYCTNVFIFVNNLLYGNWHSFHGLKKHAKVSLLHYIDIALFSDKIGS